MQRSIIPDGAKGPLAHNFWPVSFQIRWSSMHKVMPGGLQHEAIVVAELERAFGENPAASMFNSALQAQMLRTI
jgi:hypothetical protein